MSSTSSRASVHRFVQAASITVAILGLIGTSASASPQRRPQFRTEVELIQLQVSVVDDNGNFVTGLGTDDFRLRVDGKDRKITTVYEVNLGAETSSAVSAVAEAEPIPPAAWRQWILFFDAGFNSPRGVRAAQEAARVFVREQVNPRDLVGVAAFSIVTGVRLLVPLTTDRQQVLQAIGGLGLQEAPRNIDRAGFVAEMLSEGYTPEQDDSLAADAVEEAIRDVNRLEFDQYTSVVAQYSEQLGTELGKLLQTIRGRKHVVFFSKGFDDRVLTGQSLDDFAATSEAMNSNAGLAIAESGGEERFGSAEVRSALDKSVQELRAADAVIHTIDPSGVGGERDAGLARGGRSGGTFSAGGSTRSALTALATGTGGTMSWDSNNLSTALADIEQSTRSFYVVAFARERKDDDVLDIDVQVRRSGAKVASAPERLAPPPAYEDMNDMQKQAQLAEFISKGVMESDLAFDLFAMPFYGSDQVDRLALVLEVPWEQLETLAKERGDGRVQLDIFGYVLDAAGTIIDITNGQVRLNVEQMAKSSVAGLPFRYYDLLWSRPGNNQVRALVRESRLGRLSSVARPTMVPAFPITTLTVTGPVSIDHMHPGLVMLGLDPAAPPKHKADGPVAYPFTIQDTELTPEAWAAARPGEIEQLFLVAHGLTRHPFTGQTQSGLMVSLLAPGGNEVALSEVEILGRVLVPETGATQIVLNIRIPTGLDGGMYRLNVTVSDQIAGTTAESGLDLWVSTD